MYTRPAAVPPTAVLLAAAPGSEANAPADVAVQGIPHGLRGLSIGHSVVEVDPQADPVGHRQVAQLGNRLADLHNSGRAACIHCMLWLLSYRYGGNAYCKCGRGRR